MYTYALEAVTPLVFRGGKPFGEGSRDGGRFPWPSSTAGACRTAWMRELGIPAQETMVKPVLGPFLLHRSEGSWNLQLPTPVEFLHLDSHEEVVRLAPGALPEGCGCDLPDGLRPLVLPADVGVVKPGKLPRFLPMEMVRRADLGIPIQAAQLPEDPAPFRNIRENTHVALERDRMSAEKGRLFQIQALDFSRPRREDASGYERDDWALAVRTAQPMSPSLATLGGERGLAWIESLDPDPLAPPADLSSRLALTTRMSVTFATPALFTQGWRPAWLGKDGVGEPPGLPGLRLRLVAVALGRWEGISGWDLARWEPRPMRRAVPAGSTYWFDVVERPADEEWTHRIWLSAWSDAVQDRLDGWGVVVPRAGAAVEQQA